MPDFLRYSIRPLARGIDTSQAPMNLPYWSAAWGSENVRVKQKSIQKPAGYSTMERNLSAVPHAIIMAQWTGGTRNTLYLTATDLCKKETGGSNKFSYATETYVTGNVTDIVNDGGGAGKARVTGSGTTWVSGMAGDKFIITSEHSPLIEPDDDWYTIHAVNSNAQLDLTTNHTNPFAGGSAPYKIRQIYAAPTDERYDWCFCNNKFIFTSGSIDVQAYTGSGYASAVNASYAIKARYCEEFGRRLILLDHGTVRNTVSLRWSEQDDETDWTGSGAGTIIFKDNDNGGAGLSKIKNNLVIYREHSIIFMHETGLIYPAFGETMEIGGIGNAAPYGIIPFLGTDAFIGRDNIYAIDAMNPVPIGNDIRDKFFDIVNETEIKRVFGFHNVLAHEIIWVANTIEGQLLFAYDYIERTWNVYRPLVTISAVGKGTK